MKRTMCPDHWHCDPACEAPECATLERSSPCPECGVKPLPNVLRVEIEHDSGTEDPTTEDFQWKVYTFDCDVVSDTDRDRFIEEDGDLINVADDVLAKLENGLAFPINCQVRGGVLLYDTTGNQDFDLKSDGLIVWEHDEDGIGAKTWEDRHKDAEGFLREYTDWANGNCYRVTVSRIKSVAPDYDPEDGTHNGAFWEHVEQIAGLIGSDTAKEAVKEIVDQYPGAKVEIVGEAFHVM